MNENLLQLKNLLVLNHLYGLTPEDIARMSVCLNEDDFLAAPVARLHKLGFSSSLIEELHNINEKAIEEELCWSKQSNHHLVTLLDDAYPGLLREISAPPLLLFVKGDIDCLRQTQIAMVGSRNPTPAGKELATHFAEHLAAQGFVITSGLALGIDGASHEGALRTGKTIAVIGTGIDRIYPARHEALAEKIIERGALVSEFPLGMEPRKENFPRRNRIISGLSVGTLVVEAALKSGSLITARLAGEQGREVFAIPGSVHNPLAKGCHKLIKDGAKLVETAEDILVELKEFISVERSVNKNTVAMPTTEPSANLLDKDYQKLLSCVGFEVTAVDVIVARSGFLLNEVSSMLLLLELEGYIQSVPGGYVIEG